MPINKFIYGTTSGDLRENTLVAQEEPVTPPKSKDPISGGKGGIYGKQPVTRPPQVDVNKTVSSMFSVGAYHSTLFRAFALSAVATYNFYVEGEQSAPTIDISGSLVDLPRYVTLRWHTAPPIPARAGKKKGMRVQDFKPPLPAAQMDVAVTALANGYISPGVIFALITDAPAPVTKSPTKIDEDAFLLSKTSAGQEAANLIGDKSSQFAILQTSLFTEPVSVVNFIDPSIAGTFEASRLNIATNPLHLTMAGSLAKILGSLEVISEFNQDVPIQNPPPDFVTTSDVPAVTYIGYMIERFDMGKDGSMNLGRTIIIDDPTMDEFIDRQVAYGGVYTYRIRSIVQWTRTDDIDFAGVSTIDRPSAFSSLVSPPLASFYAGDWSDWAKSEVLDTVPPEPPDEVTVRPVSWKGEIRIAWKVGNDPQRDLTRFKLVRAKSSAGRVHDWQEIGSFGIANGSYVDRDVRSYEEGSESYIYALYATSYHGVDSHLSDQVEAKLSPLGSREELPVVQVGIAGDDRTVHPSGKKPPGPTEIKANRRLTFYCRQATSGHPLRDSVYMVEVRSLSTGERALVTLDVDAIDIGVTDA